MNDSQKFLMNMILEGYRPTMVYNRYGKQLCIKEKNKMFEQRFKDLKDTTDAMVSEDYSVRFVAEYYQTKIRYNKLHKMTIKYEAGTLTFSPSCSLELLNTQKRAMGEYLHALEVRAEIEGIEL